METWTCDCGKEITGFSKKQLDYLIEQHKLSAKHKNFLAKKKESETEEQSNIGESNA